MSYEYKYDLKCLKNDENQNFKVFKGEEKNTTELENKK